jgi:hypothetical protein
VASDDVRRGAEAYVDDCIAAMDEPPSSVDRDRAVAKVEAHTRELLRWLPRKGESVDGE